MFLAQAQGVQPADLLVELRRIEGRLAMLEAGLRGRDEAGETLRGEIRALRSDLAGLTQRSAPVSGPFLSAPPLASDSVGVAKAAVFAPRVDADPQRRRDTVLLKLRRIEARELVSVGELELSPDQTSADLPVDVSGGLYVADWSTSEGHSYTLTLRDGASGQPVATVQVKPLESHGRFLFVGYRLD